MLPPFANTIITVFLLFGAFQASLIMVTLNRRDTPSAKRLAAFLLAITAVLTHHAYYASMPANTIWRYVFNGLAASCWFAAPPLYLRYVKSLMPESTTRTGASPSAFNNQEEIPAKKLRRNFYVSPSAVELTLFLPAIYHLVTWLLAFTGTYLPWHVWLGEYHKLYDYVWVGSYIAVGLMCTYRVSRLLKQQESSGQLSPTFIWLVKFTRWFQWALIFTGIALLTLALLNRYHPIFEYALLTVFAIFALSVAYRSMRQVNYNEWLADQRYGEAALDRNDLPALLERLNAYLTETPAYLNPELRRSDLAEALTVSEHALTQVFTRHLGSNFYAYINGWRLRAFEARLLDGSLEHLTLAALAQACGFKSKTSLYRVFREAHGTTPGAYLKAQMVNTK